MHHHEGELCRIRWLKSMLAASALSYFSYSREIMLDRVRIFDSLLHRGLLGLGVLSAIGS